MIPSYFKFIDFNIHIAGNVDVIRALLEKGANIHAKNKAGKTPYLMAIFGYNIGGKSINKQFFQILLNTFNYYFTQT